MSDMAMPRRVVPSVCPSASTAETVAFGRAVGTMLEAGDVIVLTGDLGAGKTQLTKGIASALGVTDDITSPTFTIEMVYEGGRLPLHHFDLYRLEQVGQLEDTGIFDVLGGEGVCVIEWGEQFAEELGDDRLEITITREVAAPGAAGAAEPVRLISFVGVGVRGGALARALGEATAA